AARSGPVQPLGELAARYSLRSLTLFLLEPEAVRPGGRMPNFKLSAVDAADLAMYLLQRSEHQQVRADFSQSPAPSIEQARIAEGRRWFVELRCPSCHTGIVADVTPASGTRAQLASAAAAGCLAPDDAGSARGVTAGVPRYRFGAE